VAITRYIPTRSSSVSPTDAASSETPPVAFDCGFDFDFEAWAVAAFERDGFVAAIRS
jgi:hypothetical protein